MSAASSSAALRRTWKTINVAFSKKDVGEKTHPAGNLPLVTISGMTKATNVILTSQGIAKIVDFGLARVVRGREFSPAQ